MKFAINLVAFLLMVAVCHCGSNYGAKDVGSYGNKDGGSYGMQGSHGGGYSGHTYQGADYGRNEGYGNHGGYSGHTYQGADYGRHETYGNHGGYSGNSYKGTDYANQESYGKHGGYSGSTDYPSAPETSQPNHYPHYTGGRNKVIKAAVKSKHYVRYVDYKNTKYEQMPQIVEIDSNAVPLILHFKSASSQIRVRQSHTGSGAGQLYESKSEDEPQHLRHEVTKPIVQEVREIVTPYRRVIQEIRPVVEEIQTIVARKAKGDANDYDDDKNSGRGGIVGSVSFAAAKTNNGLESGSSDGNSGSSDGVIGAVKRSTNQYSNQY